MTTTSTLVVPPRGLATASGFRQVIVPPPLVDEAAERRAAFQKLGKYLDDLDIAHNDILVLKYIPQKIGSLLTGADTQREQRWQSKCGLVLKYGPAAKGDGFKYETGDWVFFRASDGVEMGVKCENDPNIAMCLILSPAHVIGKTSNPDLIW